MGLKTPIVFLTFNRPDLTRRVFERISQARPRQLLVVGDGPRSGHPTDKENTKATRVIFDQVDWPCEVFKNFSEVNLGCKRRVSSGLDWAFDTVEEAIVLEDDCLPHPSFFPYCESLLERFRDDSRVMAISGNNFQTGRRWGQHSYFFSKYFHCWGWASWRRVWKMVDVDMPTWPEFLVNGGLRFISDSPTEEEYWYRILQREYNGQIDSWAYAFLYTCFSQNGLAVLPNKNLVSNVGFRDDATHTRKSMRLALFPAEELPSLEHPNCVVRNKEADRYIYRLYFDRKSRRLSAKLKALFQGWKRQRIAANCHAVPHLLNKSSSARPEAA